MSLAKQILSLAAGHTVRVGEYVEVEPDLYLVHDVTLPGAIAAVNQIDGMVRYPSRVVAAFDHFVPAPTSEAAEQQKNSRNWLKQKAINHFFDVGKGVCHQLIAENGFALPGRLMIGADSHTSTSGAFGTFSISVGATELGVAIASGKIWLRVPETVYFNLCGSFAPGIYGKDLALAILDFSAKQNISLDYKVVEFIGNGLRSLSVADRMTICNMMAEAGVKSAMMRVDQLTHEYLRHIGVAGYDASFGADTLPTETGSTVYTFDLGNVRPLVSLPFSPNHVKECSGMDVPIHQAYLGSCTNGRIEDLRVAASLLETSKVHPLVRMLVAPASHKVYEQAAKEGLLEVLSKAGAVIVGPCCGACFGGHMGLLADGERCIASTNRNFPARMGHAGSEVFLASPATVAASAITGKITDPREFL